MKIFIYIALIILFLPYQAQAISVCKCGNKQSIEDELKRAFTVFVGTVTDIKIGFGRGKKTKVIFEVNQSWKGAKHKQISVWAAAQTDKDLQLLKPYLFAKEAFTCNYPFAIGQKYLVFSHRKKKQRGLSFVSKCGNTQLYDKNFDYETLFGEPILIKE